MTNRWRHLYALLFAMILVIPAVCSAHDKTDVVVLKNGNEITGEILELRRGVLSLSTDSMSTVDIKWRDVQKITSPYRFVVEDTIGIRWEGSLGPASDPGKMCVVSGEQTAVLSLESVVSMYPLSRQVWRRFSGSVSMGYSYTKTSSQTQVNIAANVLYRGIRWEGFADADSLLSTANGETNSDNQSAILGGARYLGTRWYVLAQVQYQHNLGLNLDHRNSTLAVLSRRLIQTNSMLWTAGAGAAYAREKYSGSPTTNEVEGVAGSRFQYFKLFSPKVNIDTQFLYFPSFTTSGRHRIEFNAASNIELINDFYWNLTFYESYDSRPPNLESVKNDYGVVTGISWTFG